MKGFVAHKLAVFEGIAKYQNINIMLYEQKNNSEKDAKTIWRFVYSIMQRRGM